MFNKKIYLIVFTLVILLAGANIVYATETDITNDTYENENLNVETTSQQNVVNKNMDEVFKESLDNTKTIKSEENILKKNTTTPDDSIKTAVNNQNFLKLNVSVVNNTIPLGSDFDNEVVLNKNVETVNGVPDVTKLGADYAYADENGVYTIESAEILRVMKLDSYCQQIYGFAPKYTFFRATGSNVKYIISREKWNVIARTLNGYHVEQDFTAVNPPYSITVNLSGKSRYYPIYYDDQEWINGEQYTCGPTAMSMISQALNCYASERRLSGVYQTTRSAGTYEYDIISYSPSVHMKLTDIQDTEAAVKYALQSGKMVFWHIRGHYMAVVGYNSVTNRFLCLNPSGPSHYIEAVQWASWAEMMSTDRPLKGHGFMSVTPYWNLTSSDKTHAINYYNNMGGKHVVSPNAEDCGDGYDNKVKVTVNTPSNVPKTTNQTSLIIRSYIQTSSEVIGNGDIDVYLNNKLFETFSAKNKYVAMSYVLPAYLPNKVTVTVKYTKYNKTFAETTTTFNKFTAGKTYVNSTPLTRLEGIYALNAVGKKGDTVTFTAYVLDNNGMQVNSGKAVFKLNGNTLKKNSTPIKVKVENGIAKLQFIVPAYTAKNYRLTAVFGNDSDRYEDNATFTIKKMNSQITNIVFTQSGNTGRLTAKVVDEKGDKVERETKITIKINGKTVINKVRVQDGFINLTMDLSQYKKTKHNLTIIAGENGVYLSSRAYKTFSIVDDNKVQVNISDFKQSSYNNTIRVSATIVDSTGAKINDDMKLSVKINGKTVVNKAVITNGLINQTLDLSNYNAGSHKLSLIIGETKKYNSYVFNTTFLKS